MNKDNKIITFNKFSFLLKRFFYNYTLIFVLLFIIVVVSIIQPRFMTINNLINILRQISVVGLMAVGMTYVLLIAGIDLSVGSILSLCITVNIISQDYGFIVSILATLIVGLACGLMNGLIISRLKVNAFMTTISTQILFMGIVIMVSKGYILYIRTERIFSYIGKESIAGIPVMGIILIVILIIFGFLLQKTTHGRRIYSVGFNPRASFVAGINVPNIVLSSYVILGGTTAVAGIALSSRLTGITPATGAVYLFDVITVVVLGGTSLAGGVGSMTKTIIGILLFGVINNSMNLLGFPFETQQMVKGAILVVAIFYNEYNRRKQLNLRYEK